MLNETFSVIFKHRGLEELERLERLEKVFQKNKIVQIRQEQDFKDGSASLNSRLKQNCEELVQTSI